MRNMSEFEKDLIRRIIAGTNNIPSLCDHILNHARINIKFQDEMAELFLERALAANANEIIDRISEKIITTVNLIEYLTREGYIVLYTSAHYIDDPFTFGPGITNEACTAYRFPDNTTVKMLMRSLNKTILVTQALIDYVNHGYATPDEIKHRQQLRVAWYAIKVSLLIGIIGIIFNIISLNKDTKIDQKQFEILKNEYSQISNNIKYLSNDEKVPVANPKHLSD